MRHNSNKLRALTATAASIFLLVALAHVATAQGFNEQFNTSSLDPAWQVVQHAGARVYGYSSPANRFSLTDNPGQLRYSLDPMTHGDGFTYGFQTSYGVHSCCNHDPGLELRRAFSGENWLLESKAGYFLPYTNGRNFALNVYFGDGGVGAFSVQFLRGRDVNQNYLRIILAEKTGSNPWDYPLLEDVSTGYSISGPDYTTFYFKLERAGGVLTAMWSADGIAWNTAFSHDMGAQLSGLNQRVVVAGGSWFNPAGSYADYDYISVTETNQQPVAACQSVTIAAGANCTANASINNGSFDPDGDAITISQSPSGPYPIGDTLVTLTVTDSKGATSQCSATVTVVDSASPTITGVSANPSVLWAPNHKMVNVTVNYDAADNCTASSAINCVLSVTSNEPIDGTGDGDTAPDWEVIDAHHVRLRAERAGGGNGRIYTITITCTDGSGNASFKTVTVSVPKSKS